VGRGEYFFGNGRSENDTACFKGKGYAIPYTYRLAGSVLMTAYQTEGTVVVVGRVGMVMERRHKCR
jgi:hypothetical protein